MKKIFIAAIITGIFAVSAIAGEKPKVIEKEIKVEKVEEAAKTFKCKQKVILEVIITDEASGTISCKPSEKGCPKDLYHGLTTGEKTLNQIAKEGGLYVRYDNGTTNCE